MSRTTSGVILPPIPQRRPKKHGGRERTPSVLMGCGWLIEPDGSIVEQPAEWDFNTLASEGATFMNQVFFGGVSNPLKYIGLINGGTVAPTITSTMAYLAGAAGQGESQAPGANGYNRQQVANGLAGADWTDDGIVSNASRLSANVKTFGPFSATTTMTHAFMATAATGQTAGSGKLILFLPLSGSTTANSGQSFAYQLRNSVA